MIQEKLKLLIVDDNNDDLFITTEYISEIDTFKITLDTETNYSQAKKKILENQHDIYIIDYFLGPETGLQLIRDCTQAGITKPFILLTGRGDKAVDVEATRAGVYDYLIKSELNTELIERSLRYSIYRYNSYSIVKESEKRYKEIFNKSNDIIFVLDNDFNLVDFNPALTAILGYEFDELQHRPIAKLFETAEHAARFQHYIELNDTDRDLEIILMTKTGLRKVFLASFSRIIAGDGNIKYQGILLDYTNLKKSEAEKLLKAKIETTDKLVRNLAHEIRNPLTNINLSVPHLNCESVEERKDYTDIIKRNSKRINQVISELMHLSNPLEEEKKKIEIKEIMQSAMANAMDRIKLKKISITELFPSNEVFILADKSKIEAAFLNIIINAVEAVEPEHGKLEVKAAVANNLASITIADNGPGISEEHMPYLFQPYFTKKEKGMGMGLVISQTIIESHKGTIKVDSKPGKGTCFTVNLDVV